MRTLFLTLIAIAAGLPLAARADIDELPAGTVWYFHADLAGMRGSDSGRELYDWLDGEVFIELRQEVGIDVSEEVERVTAYSTGGAGPVILVEGPISTATRDKLIALAALEGNADLRAHDGKDYFFAGETPGEPATSDPFGDLDEAAYFSFALANRLLITATEGQMHDLLERNGRLPGGGAHAGALLVLTADRSFVQAGLQTRQFVGDDDDDGWNSNILRNTEQAAILVADRNGLLALEAELRSKDERMAQSIGSVINGLIGLAAFSDDMDPEVKALLGATRVSVDGDRLRINTVVDPAAILQHVERRHAVASGQ